MQRLIPNVPCDCLITVPLIVVSLFTHSFVDHNLIHSICNTSVFLRVIQQCPNKSLGKETHRKKYTFNFYLRNFREFNKTPY